VQDNLEQAGKKRKTAGIFSTGCLKNFSWLKGIAIIAQVTKFKFYYTAQINSQTQWLCHLKY
jgi:hypothetical protein